MTVKAGDGRDASTGAASKGRIESFSDGVIAVAITLLALDLRVPEPAVSRSLAQRLGEQWPSYAAYAVSFFTIGIIWINHHAMLRRVRAVDHGILVLNLLLLMAIGVLPFSTALVAHYLTAARGEKLAAAIYGGSFLLMGVLFFALQRHLLIAKRYLLDPPMTPAQRRAVLRRNTVGLVPYAIATLAAALSPYITLAICAAVAAFYAWPSSGVRSDARRA